MRSRREKLQPGWNCGLIWALSRAEREERRQQRKADLEDVTSTVYGHLYEAPPKGYQAALAALNDFERTRGPLTDPWLWVYRACALGQKHAYEHPKGPDDEALREEIRRAVRHALLAEPDLQSVLASFYDGGGTDDDLRSLNPDVGLETLLDIQATSTPPAPAPAPTPPSQPPAG
jgi:hypothetical protein